MLNLIISHETRTLARTPALAWILLLLAAAMIFGAWATLRTSDRNTQSASAISKYEDAKRLQMRNDLAAYEEKLKATGGKAEVAGASHGPSEGAPQGTNAGAVGSQTQTFAVLPPTGLSALSVGQTDMMLTYLPVSMKGVADITKFDEIDNPVSLKTGTFDIAFVVIFFLPILILAMSYDLLSSEKERGTLAMVLAHPVTLRKLMASKLISRGVMMLLVVLVFGFGILLTVGTALDTTDTWVRFGIWIGSVLLYSLFWFGLSVYVNALGRSSATNGLILAGAWLVFVVVIPTVVSLIATTTYPAPSRFEFQVAARQAQIDAEKERMKALDDFYYDHAEAVPEGKEKTADFLTLALANNAAVDRALRPLYEKFQSQRDAQERLVENFQIISPAIMMQLTLNEAAGTGSGRYKNFIQQVFKFHAAWSEFFATKFIKQQPLTSADFDAVPKFKYVEDSVSTVMSRSLPSILGLGGIALGLLIVAFTALRRYQVGSR